MLVSQSERIAHAVESIAGWGQPVNLDFPPPKVYGIWTGQGWLRTTTGVFYQSVSPNALKAVLLDEPAEDRSLTICEIGPDGRPVEVTP